MRMPFVAGARAGRGLVRVALVALLLAGFVATAAAAGPEGAAAHLAKLLSDSPGQGCGGG